MYHIVYTQITTESHREEKSLLLSKGRNIHNKNKNITMPN